MTTFPEKDPADKLLEELRSVGWPHDDGRKGETPEIFTYREQGTKSGKCLLIIGLVLGVLAIAYLFFS